MSDVLAFSVPIETAYPSVNHTGAGVMKLGKKTEAYHALFKAVKETAEAEMERTGWTKAECECLATFVRYLPDRRTADALNLAKCEADSLEKAGVWVNDRLANPATLLIRFDPAGPHRVAIVVVKLYQPAVAVPEARAPRSSERRAKRTAAAAMQLGTVIPVESRKNDRRAWKAGDPIPDGFALLDGKLVSMKDAMAMVAGEKKR